MLLRYIYAFFSHPSSPSIIDFGARKKHSHTYTPPHDDFHSNYYYDVLADGRLRLTVSNYCYPLTDHKHHNNIIYNIYRYLKVFFFPYKKNHTRPYHTPAAEGRGSGGRNYPSAHTSSAYTQLRSISLTPRKSEILV